MTDTSSVQGQVPADVAEMMRRRGLGQWALKLSAAENITPNMRRLTLDIVSSGAFNAIPGQDLVFILPDASGALGRRHYTIRRFHPVRRAIDVDVFIHGSSTPGTMWALNARPGDAVEAFGPRGRNVLHPGADWRLFVGDDTAVPAILGMIEALPEGARAHAILEVQSDADRQDVSSAGNVDVSWQSRGGAAPVAASAALIGAVEAFALPSGNGHAYLLAETSTIRRLRHDLIARGLGKEQIFGEGYWRPGRLGGHDHLEPHH